MAITGTGVGAGLMVGGSVVGGYGNLQANKKNKATKEQLRRDARRLEKLIAGPQEDFYAGLQPGEEGREALMGPEQLAAWAAANSQGFNARAAGSRTSARARADLAKQGIMELLGRGEATANANVAADSMIAQNLLAKRGMATQPVNIAQNPYTEQASFLNTLGAGIATWKPETTTPPPATIIFVEPDGTQTVT